jgi:hypothetical protein
MAFPPSALATSIQPILFFNVKGRDGSTAPLALPTERCEEALNVDWYESSLGHKRGGSITVDLSGGTNQTGVISFLFSHVPANDQGDREMWAIDDAATPIWKRLSRSSSWADVTVNDAISSKPWEVNAVSFNGKLFFAYDTTVNRLHVWDPADAKVRRSGIDKASAPTAANGGGVGTYAAIIRYYRLRWVKVVSSATVLAGDLSTSLSITPDAAHVNITVTQPTPPGEGETHWELFGSADGANFFRLSQIAVATTTYTDTADPSTYSGTLAPDLGAFKTFPSARYLSADAAHLIGTGAWETAAGNSHTPKANRIWWTSPLASTDNGDDERCSDTSTFKNYADVTEATTGISLPIDGAIYVFSFAGCWKMIPTTVPSAPYIVLPVTGGLGCIQHKTIIRSVDESGNAALYWLSQVGPLRRSQKGQERLHFDIDDIWRTVNVSATTMVAHGVDHRDKHQLWWWVATGSSNEPDTRIVFDTNLGRVTEVETAIRRGWSKHTGEACSMRCSTMHSNTFGTSMSRDLKPYGGYLNIAGGGGAHLWRCDTTDTTDNGNLFQAYLISKAFTPWGIGNLGGTVEEGVLVAKADATATINLTIRKDFAAVDNDCGSVALAAAGSETRVFPMFTGTKGTECNTIQIKIGDSAAVASGWNLDAFVLPVAKEGTR